MGTRRWGGGVYARRASALLLALLVTFVASGPLLAQGDFGVIEGTAVDEQGVALPGVTVTLRNQASGVSRVVVTAVDGRFRLPAIPPGKYLIKAELSGFSTQEVRDVEITIGLGLKHDFSMRVQSVQETVTVVGDTPMVDVTRSEVAGVVTQQQIETLPINSRQYLSLALLMPGTSQDATRSFFATVNVGGSMTFNSTGNIVDGVINNFAEDGEPRQDFAEDAVQEFKVSNVQYKAEFGLATGGVVQVVTKSGSNDLHGNAFEYFRSKALNAKGVFETVKPDYRRDQFGGSLGGPIVRNRMHYYGAYERTSVDEFYTVNTGQPQFYSAVEGTFLRPSFRNLYFGRVDGQISNAQSFFVRYAQEDEESTCSGCGGTVAQSAGFDQDTPRKALVAGHTWTRGSRALNEFRFQYAPAAYYISPSGTEIWKTLGDFSPARIDRLSRSYVFPSLTYGSSNDQLGPEARLEFKDTYALTFSRHELKFGADISHNSYQYREHGQSARHVYVHARSVFQPGRSRVDRRADRRGNVQRQPAADDHAAPDEVLRRVRRRRLAAPVQPHRQSGPALRAALRRDERGSRHVDLPDRDSVHRRLEARRHEQLRPPHGVRVGCRRERPVLSCAAATGSTTGTSGRSAT